ncbi:TPA: hypothetical protein TZ181_002163, partial [Streptococcus suis]|nr:hypothetical protein [Streptococcus suis]
KRLTQNKEVEPHRKETRSKKTKTAEEHYFDWIERMAATVQEHLHLPSPPKVASELEAIVEPFITTDLDRLFARRLSLALDTQRVESSQILSVHQAIDQLDRQINEQLQEKELQTSKIAEDYLLTAVRGDLPTLEELYSSAIFSDKPSVVEYLKDWSANTEEVQRVIDFLTQLDPVRRDWLTPVEYFLDDIRTSQLEEDIADEEEQQGQVATLDQKEKAPDRGQEPISNAGDLHRNPDSLGDISPRTASKPVVNESQPDFPVIAPLKFTTKGEWMSTLKPGYHVITDGELRRLNKFAPGLQATAQWYLNELAGSTITYLYQDRDGIGRLDVQFSDENFAHLTGISPKGTEMKQVVYDFANGQGDYGNIQVSHSIKDKSMVLPLLPDILSSQAFVFNDLSTVEKFHKIDLEQAIKTDDEDLLLAIRDVDGIGVPASIMRIKEKLSVELEGKEQVVLGVYRERDDIIEQLSIHPDYVKDGGQSMMTVLKNKQYETLSTSQTIEEEKKIPSLSSDRLHDDPALPVSIMDSDADGISDEEEKKQGSNPYDFRSQPATKHQEEEEREEQVVEDSSLVVANLIQNQDIAGLNRHLKDGIKEYLDSDKYKDYLTKMSQLNNYSSRNLRLILAQQPTASQVTSFKQWKETFGRHVKKGEKALRIFVPITYIKKDENN